MSLARANRLQNLTDGPTELTKQWAAKAWLNFNGTGVVAIRASGNVSSLTDNGTGDYTINMATALRDANYAPAFGNAVGGAPGYADIATGMFHSGSPGVPALKSPAQLRVASMHSTLQNGWTDINDYSVTLTHEVPA